MNIGAPGLTLGVVGGGQLGRMLAEAASPLGVEVVVADPTPEAPASSVARDQIVGGFGDAATLEALAKRSDALTFEIELADPGVLERVSQAHGVEVHPSPASLGVIEDKLVQKRRFEEAGVRVPAFRAVGSVGELREALDALGCPAMLKARRDAYDGRGNVLIESREEAGDALEAIGGEAMVEAFVPYDRELSVIGCRGRGERALFPVTETIHEEEILRETVAPARCSDGVRDRALALAQRVLDVMEGRGVFGIEMFEVEGAVLLNEVAPRPHNSGHWTIEGCITSQFEQHVRAVLGFPLGSTEQVGPSVSTNLLADVEAPCPARVTGFEEVLGADRAHLHWYGKGQARPLRKMGHVTVTGTPGADVEGLLARARALRQGVRFRSKT